MGNLALQPGYPDKAVLRSFEELPEFLGPTRHPSLVLGAAVNAEPSFALFGSNGVFLFASLSYRKCMVAQVIPLTCQQRALRDIEATMEDYSVEGHRTIASSS